MKYQVAATSVQDNGTVRPDRAPRFRFIVVSVIGFLTLTDLFAS